MSTNTDELREQIVDILDNGVFWEFEGVSMGNRLEVIDQVIALTQRISLEARYDELEKARQVIQNHQPDRTLAGVYMALNDRSLRLSSQLQELEQ